jgi:hypothetical protein
MHDFDELTIEERERLTGLPRQLEPGRLLEERTVRALRQRGLLRPRGTYRAWWAAAAAAAIGLFATGFAVGQRSSIGLVSQLADGQQATMQLAQQVQRTGSAYVAALAALAEVADSTDTGAVRQGREAAQAALYAAASEFASLAPRDPVASQILWLLPGAGGLPADTVRRSVIWF